ncbi:hypothetical protein L1987_14495 [Smallanthus sonchifolius]|uniref:Uncharacterized protein n=1 Tax=Smallanthus sonchifolius TaxID=185202 RepID=A0ACB9J3U1_9ASTR|nr:hypothetical protein L1987_14495 [Smallanthus sonchifolius]
MAEVVVSLVSILALQEKANNTLQPTSMQFFARKALMVIFPSNHENSGGSSLNPLELYLDTVGVENQTLQRFDLKTLILATESFSEANNISPRTSEPLYKGKLQNGQSIAVARLSYGTGDEYFINEASILVKLEHENLAKGYMAPEYLWNGDLSTKADVYSLGVLVFETMTGHKVGRNWFKGTLSNIIDPKIDVDSSSATRYLEIGLLCVQTDAEDRPTIEEVVSMLLDSSPLTLRMAKVREMITRGGSNSTDTLLDYNIYNTGGHCYDYDTDAVEEFISELFPR